MHKISDALFRWVPVREFKSAKYSKKKTKSNPAGSSKIGRLPIPIGLTALSALTTFSAFTSLAAFAPFGRGLGVGWGEKPDSLRRGFRVLPAGTRRLRRGGGGVVGPVGALVTAPTPKEHGLTLGNSFFWYYNLSI